MAARYIGSSAASRLVGISVPTLYTWHDRKLHPKKNDKGNWVYEREEIIEFARWYEKNRPRYKKRFLTEGEKAGAAFQLFEGGHTVSHVVMRLDIEPGVAEKWFAKWRRDAQNLPLELEEEKDLEIKKTKVEIAKEELAIRRAARKELERKAAKRMERDTDRDRSRDARENALPELPTRENTPLHEVFAHAAGVKK